MEVVLDASVFLKWLRPDEQDREAALQVRAAYQSGELLVVVPPLLFLEVLNVAARRWRWQPQALELLAGDVSRLGFSVRQPSPVGIARWAGRGLSAYDACYVALAEERRSKVVTADEGILTIAPVWAQALATYQ